MRTFILQRFQVYGRVCLIFAIAASPTVFNRKTQDVFNLLKFTVLWVAGLAAVMFFLIWAAERGVWPPRAKLFIAGGAFLAACLIATIFSSNPLLSAFGLYHRYGGAIPFALYALIMVAVVGLYWEKPQDLKDLAKGSAIASVLLLSYVLIQQAGQDWIAWKDSSNKTPPYPVGTMGNSNFAGAYLGIAVPFLIYLAMTARNEINRMIFWVLTGLDLLALWFTQTRGGMIAGAVGTLMMAFFFRDRLPRWVKVSTVVSAALGALLVVLVLWHPGSDRPPGPLAEIETFRTGTFSVRTYYWATAWRIFLQRPLTGVGLELYYANYPKYRLPQDGAELGLTITDKPHNIFLEYLANGGIITAAAYFALVGLALWYGIRRAKDLDWDRRALLGAYVSVLAGYLAQGFFSIDVPPLAVMGWLAIGGIAAIADPAVEAARAQASSGDQAKGKKRKARQSSGYRVNRHGPTRWAVHIPTTLLLGALIAVGVRPLMADAASKTAQTNQRASSDATQVIADYRRAIELNPWEASYRSQLGAFLESTGMSAQDPQQKLQRFQMAEDYYEQALKLQPGNIFYTMNLARLYTSWAEMDPARFSMADAWWKKVVEHDPTDWDVHNRYALMLNAWANARNGDRELRERTIDELQKVVRIRPDTVAAWINIAKIYRALGRDPEAEKALEEALKVDPDNDEAATLLRAVRNASGSGSSP